MIKRFIICLCVFAAVMCGVSLLPESGSLVVNSYAASGYTLNLPTQDEIRAKYREYNINLSESVTYTEDFSLSAPYAMGNISSHDRQNGLNAINFCRYIAGLPSDVELDPQYNEYTQAASLVNAANGRLSHSPSKPEGMSDELYDLGYTGASSSNIGMGYTNIAHSVIKGYMEDSDSSNIDRVGHRRWILNPAMKYTGLGYAGRYTALYAFDTSRQEAFVGDYVAWPPANMPIELYSSYSSDYAFSVSLGNDYDTPSLSEVTVDITSSKLGRSWHLDQSSRSYSEYLTVENSGYGMRKCIIFNVGMFPVNDSVSVTINGVTKGGASAPISYTVNFFEIEHKYSSKVTKAATCTDEGIRTYTCSSCKDSYTEPIAKTDHSYSAEWTIDKAATCVSEGSKSHHCKNCGETKDITVIPKIDHNYTSTVTKAATCTASGVETLKCSVCNNVMTKNIAATGHSYGEYKVTVKPTAEKEGTEERTCSVCGSKEQRKIAKLSDTGSSSSGGGSSSSTGADNENSTANTNSEDSTANSEESSSLSENNSSEASSSSGGSSSVGTASSNNTSSEETANSLSGNDSSTSAESSDSDSGLPLAAWIAIAVAAASLISGVVILSVLLSKKKK